ncbi:MAG: YIP1 family protein [Clostridiales Family XIII bacterium]|nr:YIP1 family protein [Clostridiales Family XIII bacterium]
MRKICTVLLFAVTLFFLFPTAGFAADDMPYESYVYDTDGQEQPAPPLYDPERFLRGNLGSPSDFCVYEDMLYCLDGASSRIVVLDAELNRVGEIALTDESGKALSLSGEGGLFVAESGIYMTDPAAEAVYRFDLEGVLSRTFSRPDSPQYNASIPFRALRVLVDGAGNVYAVVDGMYEGAVLFSPDGEFLGYYGAINVEMTSDMRIDQLWKRLLSDEQRSAMQRFIPVAYSSFDIDHENFIYTCSQFAEVESARVRKLNPTGKSLWSNRNLLFGDPSGGLWVEGLSNESLLIDIDVARDGSLAVLDSAKGRVFFYDSEGRMMGVIGGKGRLKGTFEEPVAVETLGDRVFVLDKKDGSVTSFAHTGYGAAYYRAVALYNNGEYQAAMPYWREVLRMNAYSEAAALGMGKALFAEGDMEGALKLLRESHDREQYSLVFSRGRLDYMRDHFVLIAVMILFICAALFILHRFRWFGLSRKLKPISAHLAVMIRPVGATESLIEHGRTHPLIACGIVVVWLLVEVVKYFGGGFIFNENRPEDFNLLFVVTRTAVVYALFILCNWSISTLNMGKGTARMLGSVCAYALLPYIFCQIVWILLSRIFTLEEGMFLAWIAGIGFFWSAVLLFALIMTVHHYSFGQAVANILLTLLGICVVLFLICILLALIGNVTNIFEIIYKELLFRRY